MVRNLYPAASVVATALRPVPTIALALGALAWLAPPAAHAQPVPLTATRVAVGLSRPVYVTAAPGDTSRLFIVEQHTGMIKILNLTTGAVNATPFLDIDGIATGNEQGLLGLAFHPDYATNGQFYVNLTAPGGTAGITQIRRYARSAGNPNVADPASVQTVLTYDQPQENHNGGWLAFSPRDRYLYIASGDGGGGNDTGTGHTSGSGNAQDTTANLLGKILRIDVDGDDFTADPNRNYRIPRGGAGQPPPNPFADTAGDDEIWAYGLRNPWRPSFDRTTGALFIADVGQSAFEEINFQPGTSAGGENYGWRALEGTTPTGLTAVPSPRVDPFHTYGRSIGQSITGGYVYRGGENALLDGTYFFADFVANRIFTLKYDGATVTEFFERTGQIPANLGSIGSIASFGEDAQGRLYVVDLGGGEVFRIVPVPEPATALLLLPLAPLLARRQKR